MTFRRLPAARVDTLTVTSAPSLAYVLDRVERELDERDVAGALAGLERALRSMSSMWEENHHAKARRLGLREEEIQEAASALAVAKEARVMAASATSDVALRQALCRAREARQQIFRNVLKMTQICEALVAEKPPGLRTS
jgi:hypothetical protein